ncbi:MAG: hypothetical protein KAR84_07935 [Elusimicrobiales bacterium]|nr:hypothetical protein [Elusimicrobiales bacterium]MCK5358697.1 hypothetical protein [Elusimicrobiales bacterium]
MMRVPFLTGRAFFYSIIKFADIEDKIMHENTQEVQKFVSVEPTEK